MPPLAGLGAAREARMKVGKVADDCLTDGWWAEEQIDEAWVDDKSATVRIKGPLPAAVERPTTPAQRREGLAIFAAAQRLLTVTLSLSVLATDRGYAPSELYVAPADASVDLVAHGIPDSGPVDSQWSELRRTCARAALDLKVYGAASAADFVRWLTKAAGVFEHAQQRVLKACKVMVWLVTPGATSRGQRVEYFYEVAVMVDALQDWTQRGRPTHPTQWPLIAWHHSHELTAQQQPAANRLPAWLRQARCDTHAVWRAVMRAADCGYDTDDEQAVAIALSAQFLLPTVVRADHRAAALRKRLTDEAGVDVDKKRTKKDHVGGGRGDVPAVRLRDLAGLFGAYPHRGNFRRGED